VAVSPFHFALSVVVATFAGALALTRLSPETFRLSDLALPAVLFAAMTTFTLAGAPWVYERFPGEARDTYLAVMCLGLLSTIGGAALTGRMLGRPRPAAGVSGTTLPAPAGALLLVPTSLLAIAVFGVYLRVVPELPLVTLLRGDATRVDLDLAREDALKLIPGSIRYVFRIVRTFVFPFLAVATYIEAKRRRRLSWWALFACVAGVGLLFAAATLEKSTVGALLIVLYFGALLARGRRLTPRRLVVLGTLGLAFPIFVTSGSVGFDLGETGRVLRGLGRRIFYLPAEVIYRYVDYTYEHSTFLMGRTLPYVSKFLPGGPIAIDNVIYLQYYKSGTITSGNAGAGYLGQLWIDFGWYGVIVGGFVVGACLATMQWVFEQLPRTTPLIALRAVIVYQVVSLTSASFATMLDPLGPGFVWGLGSTFVLVGLLGIHHRRLTRTSSFALSPT